LYRNDFTADEVERLPEGLKIIKGALFQEPHDEVISAMIHDNPRLSSIIPDQIIEKCDFYRKLSI
jgi:predicted methyltransferase